MEHTGPVDDDTAADLPPTSSHSFTDGLDGVQVSEPASESPRAAQPGRGTGERASQRESAGDSGWFGKYRYGGRR